MNEEVQEAVSEEEYSDFANSLKEALSTAAGKEPVVEEVEEEVAEEVIEETTEDIQEDKEPVIEEKEEEFKLIPKEWNKEEKAKFEAALENPDLKDAAGAFIDRYENLKRDYYKKSTERAEFAKTASVWDDVFNSDAKAALEARGIDAPEYVKRLLNVERQLINNPAETIKRLMDTYKVDLKTITGDSLDDVLDYDETLTEIKKELKELKNEKVQSQTNTAAAQQNEVAKQVKDFEFAVDETGELKFPMFKNVKDEMGILLQKGTAKTLEEAYNMSPTVKIKTLEENQVKNDKASIEDDKRKIAKAKKAARGVTNKRIVQKPPVKMTLEERLRENFAESKRSN
jgi:hypothetical protein